MTFAIPKPKKAQLASIFLLCAALHRLTWRKLAGGARYFRSTSDSSASTVEKSPSFIQCLDDVLHNELPIGFGHKNQSRQPAVWQHHYAAGNHGLWNEYDRLKPMDILADPESDCSIWEVGAHRGATDSKSFLAMYPHCKTHAYEPVSKYFTELQTRWEDEDRMTTHNYGLGLEPSTFQVPESVLDEQSTFLGGGMSEAAAGGNMTNIEIKSFETAIEEAGGLPTVFHVNCEGCEWDMVPELAKSGFLEKIPIIQISWHNYGKNLGTRVWELCKNREMLSKTHDLTLGKAFGWERWERKSRG